MKECSICKKIKPLEDFAYKNKAKGIRHYRCKECKNNYNSTHYSENKDYYIQKAEKQKKQKRDLIRKIKSDTPCADCGKQYPYYVMDFDHRESADKEFLVSRGPATKSLRQIKAEIKKCDVVCSNCHRERTYQRRLTKKRNGHPKVPVSQPEQ